MTQGQRRIYIVGKALTVTLGISSTKVRLLSAQNSTTSPIMSFALGFVGNEASRLLPFAIHLKSHRLTQHSHWANRPCVSHSRAEISCGILNCYVLVPQLMVHLIADAFICIQQR